MGYAGEIVKLRETVRKLSSTNQLGKPSWGLAQGGNKLADMDTTTQPSPKFWCEYPSEETLKHQNMDAVHRLNGGRASLIWGLKGS